MPAKQTVVLELLKRPGNDKCADCETAQPRWASVNLGIFVCQVCSGVHRQLGTHISKVKSLTLDEWRPEWINACQQIGNARARAYYEHNVPPGVKYSSKVEIAGGDRIDPAEGKKLEKWIRAKYEHKEFAPPGVDEPHVRLSRGEKLDDNDAPGTDGKHHKRSSTKNRRSSSRSGSPRAAAAAASQFPEAFATLGAWATEGAPPGSPAMSAGSRRDKKEKKEKKDKKMKEGRRRSFSGSSQPGWELPPAAVTADAWGGGGAWDMGGVGGMLPSGMVTPVSAGTPVPGMAEPGALQQYMLPQWTDSMQNSGRANVADNIERRSALTSISRLFMNPAALGLDNSVQLITPYGFDLYTAEFQSDALKKPRPPGEMANRFRSEPQQDFYSHATTPAAASEAADFGWNPKGAANSFESMAPLEEAAGMNGDLAAMALGGGSSGPGMSAGDFGGGYADEASKAKDEQIEMLRTELFRLHGEMRSLEKGYGEVKESQRTLQKNVSSALGSPVPASAMAQDLQWAFSRPGLPTDTPQAGFWVPNTNVPGLVLPHTQPVQPVQQQGLGAATTEALSAAVAAAVAAAVTAQKGVAPPEPVQEKPLVSVNQFNELQEELKKLREELKSIRSEPTHSQQPSAPTTPFEVDLGTDRGQSQATSPARFEWHDTRLETLDEAADEARAVQTTQASDLAKHAELFYSTDLNGDGFVEGVEARALLDQSALPPEDLAIIWHLSDIDQDGRLNLEEFVCALCLVSSRREGRALPTTLPADLAQSVATFAAEQRAAMAPAMPAAWSPADLTGPTAVQQSEAPAPEDGVGIAAEQLEQYRNIFSMADKRGTGFLTGEEAKQVLESSQLPTLELSQIWRLSDIDADGQLTFGEFVLALELVTRRRQQLPLPDTLPADLAAFAASQHFASAGAAANTLPAETESVPASPPTAGRAQSSPWKPEGEQLEQYIAIFRDLTESSGATAEQVFLGPAEARRILEKSELPTNELSHIWHLADVDQDGQLTLLEFVYAMHLAARRRQGVPLPPALPPELATVRESVYPSNMADGGAPTKDSPWVIDEEQLDKYQTLFKSVDLQRLGILSNEKSSEMLALSGLPPHELKHIWRLADLDGDGQLIFPEFVRAMHLAARRRQGLELPAELPTELGEMPIALTAMPSIAAEKSETVPGLVHRLTSRSRSSPSNALNESPWLVTPAQQEQYQKLFQVTDAGNKGVLTSQEARVLLERSQLPDAELSHIWRLSDVDRDGQLTIAEFMCAMQLASQRRRGLPLPDELPHELATLFAASHAPPAAMSPVSKPGGAQVDVGHEPGTPASTWAIEQDELDQYRKIFAAVGLGAGSLRSNDLWEMLEKSGLSEAELTHIWQLSCGQGDLISFDEFLCAMHLVSRRRQGADLPPELPMELAARFGSPGGHRRTDSRTSASFMSGPAAESSVWVANGEQIAQYCDVFLNTERGVSVSGAWVVGPSEARTILDKSQLPQEELMQIWLLSDVDQDGQLTLPEFARAMHLASQRRQGFPLPTELPAELAAQPGTWPELLSAEAAARPQPGGEVSPWLIRPDELQAYRHVFESLDERSVGILGPDQAKVIFERSQLPQAELAHIWHMCDVDKDGCLTFGEFISAWHIVLKRRQGEQLPPILPTELAAYIENSGSFASASNGGPSGFSSPGNVVDVGSGGGGAGNFRAPSLVAAV